MANSPFSYTVSTGRAAQSDSSTVYVPQQHSSPDMATIVYMIDAKCDVVKAELRAELKDELREAFEPIKNQLSSLSDIPNTRTWYLQYLVQ